MKDRIRQYIDYKSISAGELSSLLDVQRSNISHILNGRNKPGASFIEKLLVAFPDLNARWLLTGDGEMIVNVHNNNTQPQEQSKTIEINREQLKTSNDLLITKNTFSNKSKPIDKIVILFADGTFTDFNR